MAFKFLKMNEGIILAKANIIVLSIYPPAKAGSNSWRQFIEAMRDKAWNNSLRQLKKMQSEMPHGFSLWTKKIKIKLALAK